MSTRVGVAQGEARGSKAERIDIEHILHGVLTTASTEFERAETLRSIGIDLDAVRNSVESSFGGDVWAQTESKRGLFGTWGRHIPFTKDAKKTLELALREAAYRKDRRIGSEHVLLGILRSPNETTRRVIEANVGLAELRARVEASLERAA